MVVAQYYTRISIKRLAELLDLPPAEVQLCGRGDLRGGGMRSSCRSGVPC